jgi:hypothetical protein
MDFTGYLKGITQDFETGKFNVTFEVNEGIPVVNFLQNLFHKKLNLSAKQYRDKRSNDANGLLWSCLGEMAKAMNPPVDKWDVYLQMLKAYGKYTYICVKPNMVEAMKKQWRECEVVGEININGKEAVQMLCYFGSSTYDSKEFSVLLDGVISEMENMKLPTPPSKEMRKLLEEWEKKYG